MVRLGSNERGFGKIFYVKNFIYHNNEDFALLEITPEIISEKSEDNKYYKINGICLPEENITNKLKEEAILSGFGSIDVNGKFEAKFLRKATYMIEVYCLDAKNICVNKVRQQACFVRSLKNRTSIENNYTVICL